MKNRLLLVAIILATGMLHAQTTDSIAQAKLVNLDANISYGTPTLGLYTQEQRAVSIGLGASATLLDGHLSLRASVSDLLNNNLTSTTVAAPTYAANSSIHTSSRYITFGLTWRIGKLDLEYQARSGAAGQ